MVFEISVYTCTYVYRSMCDFMETVSEKEVVVTTEASLTVSRLLKMWERKVVMVTM